MTGRLPRAVDGGADAANRLMAELALPVAEDDLADALTALQRVLRARVALFSSSLLPA